METLQKVTKSAILVFLISWFVSKSVVIPAGNLLLVISGACDLNPDGYGFTIDGFLSESEAKELEKKEMEEKEKKEAEENKDSFFELGGMTISASLATNILYSGQADECLPAIAREIDSPPPESFIS